MPGYFQLKEYKSVFSPSASIDLDSDQTTPHYGNPYSYHKQGNVVTVQTPIYFTLLPELLRDIGERIDLEHDHLLIGVVSQGITEEHVVALHIPPKSTQYFAYDSKFSNPEKFFLSAQSIDGTHEGNANNPIIDAIKRRVSLVTSAISGLFQTLNPSAHKPRTINEGSIVYNALGTQSFFDGVSCGYHCSSNLKLLAQLIHNRRIPTTELLLAATKNSAAESAQLINDAEPGTVKLSFSAFLNQAWQDTFLAHVEEKERKDYHFGHYFMGWPPANGSKVAYFATLKFITTPLVNVLSLATEFPLNLLSESASYLKNKLISWAPTHVVTQGIRSLLLAPTIGLQAVFKGLSYLVRVITSPIVSFKEAYKQSPILGYLSAAASVLLIGGGLAALAVFAPLIVAALAPSMGPGALTLLSTLAAPALQALAMMGMSVSVATAAALTLISATLVTGALHLLGRKVIYPSTGSSPSENPGQNVSGNVVDDFIDIDDYDFASIPHSNAMSSMPTQKSVADTDTAPVPLQNDMIGNGLGRLSRTSSQEEDYFIVDDDFNPNPDQVKMGSNNSQ